MRMIGILRKLSVTAVLASFLVEAMHAGEEWGSLELTVRYDGDKIPATMNLEPTRDIEYCGKTPIRDERLVVDAASKGIKNFAIYVYEGRAGIKLARKHPSHKKKRSVEIGFEGCRFVPHVLSVAAGDELLVRNDQSEVLHAVNISFVQNYARGYLVPPGQIDRRLIKHAEPAPVPVDCNIHPWMRCYLIAQDHRYVGVSDMKGKIKIDNLPAGETLAFRAWHESLHLKGLQLGDGELDRRNLIRIKIKPGINDLGIVSIPADRVKAK